MKQSQLQPLSGEQFKYKSANKDEEVDGVPETVVTGVLQKIVSPMARSYSSKTSAQLFRDAENAKNREYRAYSTSRARRFQPTGVYHSRRNGSTVSLGCEADR